MTTVDPHNAACKRLKTEVDCAQNEHCIWQEEFWPTGCESNKVFMKEEEHPEDYQKASS